MSVLLGCVGDDSTGSTDLANTLVKNGFRTVQLIGVPGPDLEVPEADAIVVALKSRTAPVEDAVAESLQAMQWLKQAGAKQFFFKYCSTFDSTEKGNIGPVAEAMLEACGGDLTIACSSFPEAGRTIYQGHLFIWDALLSDTHMRTHPLTPMTDSNLVRFLGKQTKLPVGLVNVFAVEKGPEAIREAFARLKAEGKKIAVVDALSDRHLYDIGTACADMALLTGGSGLAMGLPENFRRTGLAKTLEAADLPSIKGPEAVISGSCSAATLGQVQAMEGKRPIYRVDPLDIAKGRDVVAEILAWAAPFIGRQCPIIASSAAPEKVKAVQEKLGRMQAGDMVEKAFAALAVKLVERGVRRLVVAGGETSGAVVKALGVKRLRIGAEIAPGVPCTVSLEEPNLALALKSGNFGGPDFFEKAFQVMP